MRLLEEARVGQIGHHVANRGWTQAFAVGARKRARSDWLAGRDKGLDDGGQNFAFAIPDIGVSRHDALCQSCQSGQPGETASDSFYLTILDAEGWVWEQSWDSVRIPEAA